MLTQTDGVQEYSKIESAYNSKINGRSFSLDTKSIEKISTPAIYVRDTDCGGYISLNTLNVVDEDFISNNPGLFVTPTPPQIIIPPPPIPSPTNIINQWFSPDDRAYSIWFVPELETVVDSNGETCLKELTILQEGFYNNNNEMKGTRELQCDGTTSDLNHENPITGTIDKETGLIDFTIDRSNKGLGTERFTGAIIDPSFLPENYQVGGKCGTSENNIPEAVMLITSENTGRKLILYRYREFESDDDIYCQ